MLCQNCGESIIDAAKFCSFCGAPQAVQPTSQPASADAAARSPMADTGFEASDVTVLLPRRRANAVLAAAARDEAASFPSAANTLDKSPPFRLSAPALKIGGAAAIVLIAVLIGVLFYANRPPAANSEKVRAQPASAAESTAAPMTTPPRSDPADRASANTEAPSIPAMEPATATKEAPIAEAPRAPEMTPEVPANRTVAPAKEAAQRKKGRAPAAPVAAPAPVETAAPQPVAVESPTPAPVTAPPPEPAKVERVACADNANPFSRELCLWEQCAKPEFRSHAECARFTGPGGQR